MVKSNSYNFSVTSIHDVTKPRVYFSRVVNDVEASLDINVVLTALRMLFNADNFKITVETYGA